MSTTGFSTLYRNPKIRTGFSSKQNNNKNNNAEQIGLPHHKYANFDFNTEVQTPNLK